MRFVSPDGYSSLSTSLQRLVVVMILLRNFVVALLQYLSLYYGFVR